MVTKRGIVKRTPLSEFESPPRGRDHCAQAGWGDELLVTSQNENVIRIPVRDILMQGGNTQGVRIMRLDKGDPGGRCCENREAARGCIVVANGVDESSNADGDEE